MGNKPSMNQFFFILLNIGEGFCSSYASCSFYAIYNMNNKDLFDLIRSFASCTCLACSRYIDLLTSVQIRRERHSTEVQHTRLVLCSLFSDGRH